MLGSGLFEVLEIQPSMKYFHAGLWAGPEVRIVFFLKKRGIIIKVRNFGQLCY